MSREAEVEDLLEGGLPAAAESHKLLMRLEVSAESAAADHLHRRVKVEPKSWAHRVDVADDVHGLMLDVLVERPRVNKVDACTAPVDGWVLPIEPEGG